MHHFYVSSRRIFLFSEVKNYQNCGGELNLFNHGYCKVHITPWWSVRPFAIQVWRMSGCHAKIQRGDIFFSTLILSKSLNHTSNPKCQEICYTSAYIRCAHSSNPRALCSPAPLRVAPPSSLKKKCPCLESNRHAAPTCTQSSHHSVTLLPWALRFVIAFSVGSLPRTKTFALTFLVALLPRASCFALASTLSPVPLRVVPPSSFWKKKSPNSGIEPAHRVPNSS